MIRDEVVGDRAEFLRLHGPESILAVHARFGELAHHRLAVLLELISDLARDIVGLHHERRKVALGLGPAILAVDPPLVRHGDDRLDGHRPEPPLVGPTHHLGERLEPEAEGADKLLALAFEQRPQELALPLGLSQRRGEARAIARPLVTPAIIAHRDRARHALALDNEGPVAVQHQVVDLGDARPAPPSSWVRLWLLGVDQPQVVDDVQVRAGGEGPVQVVGHLAFGRDARAEAGVGGEGGGGGGLEDHD